MGAKTKIVIGGTLKDATDRFLDAWKRAAAGEQVEPGRVLSFESFEGFMKIMTPERHRLLLHVRQHPEPSVLALAKSLRRGYSRVHGDVVALEDAGLLERSGTGVKAIADKVLVEV